MSLRHLVFSCLVSAWFLPPFAFAEDDVHHREETPARTIELTPDLQHLLAEEMRAIQQGMMELVPAISAGKWREIAKIGKAIEHSYILKQKLSKNQVEQLHRALPPAFIELDRSFHHAAGMLAHAAEEKHAEVVNFYFFKLNEGCVSCHAKFAKERFPGFAKPVGEGAHQH